MNLPREHEVEEAEIRESYRIYLDENLEIFLDELVALRENFDVKVIHDVRVRLKRLRNFYKWVEQLYPHQFSGKVEFKPFRKIFKSIGKIRDSQVRQETLKSLDLPDRNVKRFMKWLEQLETESIAAFKEKSPRLIIPQQKEILEKFKALFSQAFEKDLDGEIHRYQEERKQSIQKLSVINDEGSIHSVRTKTKEWYYFFEINGAHPQQMNEFGGDPDKIKELGSLLGAWHDDVVLLESYLLFLDANKKEKNRDSITEAITFSRDENLLAAQASASAMFPN